jgi:signal transduction histidine kinase
MENDGTGAGRVSSRTKNRAIAIFAGLGVVAILIALGYVFSTSSSAQQVATSARSLHEANAAAGSAAIARASVAQAVVFAIDHELGVASTEARDATVAEATSTLASTAHWVDALKGDTATKPLGVALDELTSSGQQIIDLLNEGRSIQAEEIRQSDFEPMYVSLAAALGTRQSEIVDEIHRTERFAGIVGWIARLLATLLIPAAAIIAYFLLVRRQFREAELKLDTRLKAERQLSVAKDEFIAGISHELRTPLTSIYGFSEYLLENEILDPDEAMELLGLINKDSAELSRMVDDLLTAARLESDALRFRYEFVDIRSETEAAIGPMVRAGSRVSVNGEVTAWADPVRVRQIARNLVSNAIKHGGQSVGVYLETANNEAIITVSDNGDGLSSEVENRLFDRFVHDGNETLLMGSVGLGLSIAKSLAKTMGGDIRFVRAGGWTNFEVSLPLSDAGITDAQTESHRSTHQLPLRTDTVMAGQQ